MNKVEEIITLKELYERLIVLETKVDLGNQSNVQSRKHFTKMVYLIIASVLLDIVIHYVLFTMK